MLIVSFTFSDGFYQQQNFYGVYSRGGGRGGFGNPGMYYGREGGNNWRERGDNRGPHRGSNNGENHLVLHCTLFCFGFVSTFCDCKKSCSTSLNGSEDQSVLICWYMLSFSILVYFKLMCFILMFSLFSCCCFLF